MAASIKLFRCQGCLKTLNKNVSFINFGRQQYSTPAEQSEINREPLQIFSDKKVQGILNRITGFEVDKLSAPQIGPLKPSTIKLLTDEQFKTELEAAKNRLRRHLEMPPVMSSRKPFSGTIVEDPELEGYDPDNSKLVCVDISYGMKDRNRLVVVREPNGTMRNAEWDLRDRMNSIFNTKEGRNYIVPKMFEEEHLERMLSERRYIYILDRACVQFEPDDPAYLRATHRVYKAVDEKQDYDYLRSTRHFGPMAFYLVWVDSPGRLLLNMMIKNLISEARDFIDLYCIVNPNSRSAQSVDVNMSDKEVIKNFIDNLDEKMLKGQLELSSTATQDSKSHSDS